MCEHSGRVLVRGQFAICMGTGFEDNVIVTTEQRRRGLRVPKVGRYEPVPGTLLQREAAKNLKLPSMTSHMEGCTVFHSHILQYMLL